VTAVLHFVFTCMLSFSQCTDIISAVCWVMFAVPEEVATPPIDVKSQQRMTIIISEDIILSDHGSDFGPHTLDSSVAGKRLSDVKRHSSMKCFPSQDSSLSQGNAQNTGDRDTAAEHFYVNDAASTTERKLPRRTTTRRAKVSRKSTRRVRQQRILDSNINEFDDDNYVNADEGENVEFSETDSEGNEDEHVSSSDESDLEFETELARQMNISQVYR